MRPKKLKPCNKGCTLPFGKCPGIKINGNRITAPYWSGWPEGCPLR